MSEKVMRLDERAEQKRRADHALAIESIRAYVEEHRPKGVCVICVNDEGRITYWTYGLSALEKIGLVGFVQASMIEGGEEPLPDGTPPEDLPF